MRQLIKVYLKQIQIFFITYVSSELICWNIYIKLGALIRKKQRK